MLCAPTIYTAKIIGFKIGLTPTSRHKMMAPGTTPGYHDIVAVAFCLTHNIIMNY